MRKIVTIACSLLVLCGCTREDEITAALDGTWTIRNYDRTLIHASGQVDSLLHEENVGSWTFSQDAFTGDVSRYYVFAYNGSQGVQSQQGYVQIAEGGQRFILIGGTCIGCDDAYTIDAFSPSSMTLSTYSTQSDTLIYKLQMELQKQ